MPKQKINNTQVDRKLELCADRDETVDFQSECIKLAQRNAKGNWKMIHWNSARK